MEEDVNNELFAMADDGSLARCPWSLTRQDAGGQGYYKTGGLLQHSDHEFSLVSCGGFQSSVASRNCYSLRQSSVFLSGQLTGQRIGAASVLLDNGQDMLVTGGYNDQGGQLLDTTEIYPKNNGGGTVPEPLSFHCIQRVSFTEAKTFMDKSLEAVGQGWRWIIMANGIS